MSPFSSPSDKDDEITVKMGSPVCDTPLSRKRSPQTDDEKLSEATFSVPDDKRKKGKMCVSLSNPSTNS